MNYYFISFLDIKMTSKREIIKSHIEKLDDREIDDLYSDLFVIDIKSQFIIDSLKPLISYLYFKIDDTDVEAILKDKKSVD